MVDGQVHFYQLNGSDIFGRSKPQNKMIIPNFDDDLATPDIRAIRAARTNK